jgi:hypothetical protein
MSDNSNDYWSGHSTGMNNGSMPTYQSIAETRGESAANHAFQGYEEARGGSTSGK